MFGRSDGLQEVYLEVGNVSIHPNDRFACPTHHSGGAIGLKIPDSLFRDLLRNFINQSPGLIHMSLSDPCLPD